MSWHKHETCWYHVPRDAKQDPSPSLAGFDLDGTLIISQNSSKYPQGNPRTDWIWAYSNVKEMLTQFKNNGWTIVIFSNRKGSPAMLREAKQRIELIMNELGFEVWVFYAIGGAPYRKSDTGMLQLFVGLTGVKQWTQGIYCGDAAGAAAMNPWNRWSSVDVDYAKNAGLTFYEPQQRFSEFPQPKLDPQTQLIITMGQPQSGLGWDAYIPYKHTYIPIGEKKLYIIDDVRNAKREPDVVNFIYGMNASKAQRDAIRAVILPPQDPVILGSPLSVVYWYARPNPDERRISKEYIASFEPPTTEYHYRIN